MVTKMKGIYKGFKYITQIFVVKEEREMEISCPTDVKHVAHIGWDGPSGSGPTWMNEFKTAPDFSTSIGSLNERRDPKPMANDSSWSTQDFEEPTGSQATSNIHQSDPSGRVAHAHDRAHAPKKPKRKKIKSTSSPTKSSTRQPRAAKSKAAATYYDREAKPVAQVQQAQEIN